MARAVSETVQGRELIDGRAFIDACEAKWLVTLVDFDQAGLYELDGHTSTVGWLVERCGMGRSTAKEKVRVAHDLLRRPVIGAAFLDGTLTYSKARILTRLAGLDDVRDAEFVAEYAAQTADWLERRVRYWNLCHGDEPRPRDEFDQARIVFQPGFGGANGRIIIEGPNEDLARIMNVTDAYGTFLYWLSRRDTGEGEAPMEPGAEAPMEPPVLRADDTSEPVVMTPAEFVEPRDEAPMEPSQSLSQRRFGWFSDLVEEIALVRSDQLDPDRATVAVTVSYESLIQQSAVGGVTDVGTLLSGDAVRKLACDCGVSRMVTNGVSEILDVGRTTRTWTRAQRRAIRARHGHRCAVKGCGRRITEIHHLTFWENGGITSIDNGIPLCSRHHHMVHDQGWAISWDPTTGITKFIGPNQQRLDSETDPFAWAA